jgi:hypothetical protein
LRENDCSSSGRYTGDNSSGIRHGQPSQYDWRNRVLALFGDANDRKIKCQIKLLRAQSSELTKRGVLVPQASDGQVRALHGQGCDLDAEKLRADAKIEGDGFHAVLVGIDGGVILRSNMAVGDVEMLDFIDRKPMRRAGRS